MLYQRENVLNLRGSGNNIYRQFNIQQFNVLSTSCN
jgi:hypothetical protein